ncbi:MULTISPECIES: dicarboxylate/amino acid:cation symporter [unclassified Saccharopolyspora]|uniref:dicarboxylate/amino acid:cation symporter n=1 Tax=unclassified Saccharopolyspora TaxID=2646250 RepID=UPI001CD46E1D|nr:MULTISPECIES: dicarboxylate/amino acid:cation symporter [unclassified Saccharopolyspora]MCA1188857.1 dicarboxylate/amino acid:cation symporter [Saccharopolyspora sp. 6T]MCA1193914.1 dicarboxylate/amino acid:cation symporter [Saccharopolyspora sp. 6V]MCA1229262.1 dicarboxylate/amino acid:cation symporter [Saccharopolyspora sp. 6M]
MPVSTSPEPERRRPRFNPRLFAVAVVASLVVGALLGWIAKATDAQWLITTLDTIGSTFTNLLTFTVLPLIFTAIVVGITSLRSVGGGRTAARLGGKTALWFAITSLIAVVIGLAVGRLVQPGQGLVLEPDPERLKSIGEKTQGSWLDLINGLIPSNLVSAFSEGETLQVVFVALIIGAAAYSLGDTAKPFVDFNRSLFEVIQRVLGWIIRLAPIGTLGLIGNAVATYGNEFFAPLLKLIGATYAGCALVLFVVYPVLLRFVAKVSPATFFAKAWTVLQFAFVSRSSGASLPLSRQTAENLGVSSSYANFAVPLATTTKMDGCAAIYPAVGAIFIANLFGIQLGVVQYLTIVAVAVFGSIATAGVTGWFTMLTLTVSALGFPPEVVATGIAVAYAVDPIMDMARTATNVAGQIVVPTVVARGEGLIDDEVLNAPSDPPLLTAKA